MADNRLSGLDSSFLHLERGGAHMHVGATLLFEGPAPSYAEFREHLESRLHLVPRYRQKLRSVPLGQGRPVWVDDPHLNLDYHLRHTSLPDPGSLEQLRTLAARIFSQRLDRSKPLWEMWLVGGIEAGRFAIVSKSHHCLVDGVSGVDITKVIFDLERGGGEAPSEPRWIPEPEPSGADLLVDAIRSRVTDPTEALRGARAILRRPRRLAGAAREALGAVGSLIGAGMSAPPSPFNVPISPHRRFEWVDTDLATMKRIKDHHGGTVNDVVLTVVAGALGRYLRARGHSTAELELIAMVPVSVREPDQEGELGNQVSAMMCQLPVWCEDPVKRLSLVSETMGDLKESSQAVGANLLSELSDFAPPTVAAQAARLQPRQRFFNLVVTNVPGPQVPIYLCGRELEALYPMVPLAHNQAVCVGIMSYNGGVHFGLIGDYEVISDLAGLAADLEASIAELTASLPKASTRRSKKRPSAQTTGA